MTLEYQRTKQELTQDLIDHAQEVYHSDDSSYSHDKKCSKKTNKKNATQMKLKKATKSRRRKSVDKDEDDKLYSPILVVMQEKDVPVAPGYRSSSQDEQSAFDDSQTTLTNTDQVNDLIKNRILKLLNTGFHESSNENEAKNAMRLAQRLMQRHNINQALLLQER